MTDVKRKDITIIFSLMLAIMIILLTVTSYFKSSSEALAYENELLKTELSEYNGMDKIFPAYCIKCYCKDICKEAYEESGAVIDGS